MTPTRAFGLRRLGALLQQASGPVFALDGQRRLCYVNRAWEELTGYEGTAVAGLECVPRGPIRDNVPVELADLGSSFSPPPETLSGRPAGGTTLIVRAGGERIWRRVEFWPYHDAQGERLGWIGLVRDGEAPAHAPDSESQRLRSELLELRDRLRARHGLDTLIGRGPAYRRLLDQVRAAAATDVPVLITGEPGTGRRTVARAIHQLSRGGQNPLAPFDCAALPPEVLERELFGDPTAPPGATAAPRLELAPGATILLIDVSELPRDLQARLAARLAEGHPVRLLATGALDPDQAHHQSRLRTDLYYALTTLVVRLAPLRERIDELPLLAQHMLERANLRTEGRRRAGFDAEALAALSGYDWPGNLRELDRVVDAASAQAHGDLIGVEDLPAAIRGNLGAAYLPPPLPAPRTPLDETLTQVERRLIEQALTRARHNKSRAAEMLDISRPRLYRRIKELNIPDEPEPVDVAAQASDPQPGNGA